MEHIRQFDWCYSENEFYFVKENDLDNCVTERILRNKFHDPLIQSDDEDNKASFNWDEIFAKHQTNESVRRVFVAGFRGLPPFPKLSALTKQQQFQCLKVLCAKNPHILEADNIPRPSRHDQKVFEEVQTIYANEQKEFIAWAKNLWTTSHCIRALRPKPTVETTYEALFEIKAKEMESFPKSYLMAAQIPLEGKDKFEMICEKELISVDLDTLPQITIPESITKLTSIMIPQPVPEPCTKHPCKFILPYESSTTILPLTEVHRELAEYALANGASYIASENALRCIVETDRYWSVCLSVCEIITLDGGKRNVLVLGDEFSVLREWSQMRTYRVFKHLLQYAFVPDEKKSKLFHRRKQGTTSSNNSKSSSSLCHDLDDDSSEDEFNLFIVAEKKDNSDDENMANSGRRRSTRSSVSSTSSAKQTEAPKPKPREKKKNDYYKCTCEDTLFEMPPPRSFKKWRLKNVTGEEINVIVHCSHKLKDANGEVILEPIPEFQLDLGASAVPRCKTRSLALSLFLRNNATLVNIRLDGNSSEVVHTETVKLEEMKRADEDALPTISNMLGCTLGQLYGLRPGHYVLRHEPSHGVNALLYSPRAPQPGGDSLQLQFSCAQRTEVEEANSIKLPPTLVPLLLPLHKYRKILPCAFTPFEMQVAKETKKPVARQKTPPQALTWPKKKSKGKKKSKRKL